MDEPEPAVIRAAREGDDAAFEQLVRSYQQVVWRFLARLLGDAALAEDVAQETFLRLYRHLPSFAFQSKFSTWLLQIARNAGLDELRRRGRQGRGQAALPPPVPSGPPDLAAELHAALAALPVDMREALLLVEIFGLRYREAATLLEVPEGTVKSRVFHARLRLHRWASAASEPGEEPEREVGGEV